jgi:hypothetical protein
MTGRLSPFALEVMAQARAAGYIPGTAAWDRMLAAHWSDYLERGLSAEEALWAFVREDLERMREDRARSAG